MLTTFFLCKPFQIRLPVFHHQVAGMVYPVPRVDVPAFFRQGIVTRQVPVAENEIIERLLPQHFAAVSDDGFLLAPENLVRLLMGAAALEGDRPSQAERLPGMQHGKQPLVERLRINPLDNVIAVILGIKRIAMPHTDLFPVYLNIHNPANLFQSNLILKVGKTPHVMVAQNVVNLYADVHKRCQPSQKAQAVFWHNIPVFKPEIEHVAQQEEMGGITRNTVQKGAQTLLTLSRGFPVRQAEMTVREEKDLAIDRFHWIDFIAHFL